ncbi:MAG: hypothetical protein SNJ74_09930 [Fimbriimonadaceae bacterium]
MAFCAILAALAVGLAPAPKPTMAEFVGLNTHTVQFRTELYRPVARLLRNYHPVEWDLGKDAGHPTTFPFARNGVNWDNLYGAWRREGYTTTASLMFETLAPAQWTDWSHLRTYGEAFGRHFGKTGSLDAVEVGNEPGAFSDAEYRSAFHSLAGGIRATAPSLKIATCAVRVGPSGPYHKSVDTVKGLEHLYDALGIHVYAEVEPYPTWRRTNPENPEADFLKPVQNLIEWRNRHAPGKEVWVTEFGWDATTASPDPDTEFARWVGSTETQQAQWIVRAYLEFARLDVRRAYLFWFNDEDRAHVHGSSGLTRRYAPKPSFFAVAHMLQKLGDFRWTRDVRRDPGVFAAEFAQAGDANQRVWVVWVPTEAGEPAAFEFADLPGRVVSAERMPLTPGPAPSVPFSVDAGRLRLTVDGSPVYVRWTAD